MLQVFLRRLDDMDAIQKPIYASGDSAAGIKPGSPATGIKPGSLAAGGKPGSSEEANHAEALPGDCFQKAYGTVGAGMGSLVGRLTVLPVGGALAGSKLGSLLGPWGAIAGGILGAAGGLYVELHGKFKGIFPAGRIIGGLLGAITGSLAGAVIDRLPAKPPVSEGLIRETKGFSLKKLFSRLKDPMYTSHELLSQKTLDDIKNVAKEGDVLVTNNEKLLDFEIPLFLMAAEGNWTHTALYAGDGRVVESLGSKGVIERSLDELIGTNHHAMVLRPAYSQSDGPRKAVEKARQFVGKPYDNKFSLKSDDALYCIEHTYKSVKAGEPGIRLEPKKILGIPVVTPKVFVSSPDMKELYSTGSRFFYNYLSKFD